jgi:uncharacterized repeat protein (TIGR01451 family)
VKVNLGAGLATALNLFSNISAAMGSTSATNSLVGANTANTWNITAANAGNVNGSFTFSSIPNLTGGTGNDTFAFGAGGSVSGTIIGGGGTDVVTYAGVTSAVTVNLASLSGIANIVGGSGSNTLVGANTTNTWTITAANAGTVNGVSFSSFANLKGGSGNDTFAFKNGGSVSGSINGGGGTNTVDNSAVASAVVENLGALSNITTVIGGQSFSNTLTGANTANTWNITGTNAGTVNGVTFTGFMYLTGGTLNDTFKFGPSGSVGGNINGGAGTNTLDYSGYGKSVNVRPGSGLATALNLFSNISVLVGSSATTNMLVGANTANTWNLTAANAGTVNAITFSSFQNLTGGSGNDTFSFSLAGSVTGTINGGAGFNTLDYSARSVGVTVNLATSAASDVVGGVSNITGVLGGAGNNTLTAGSLNAFLVGGVGNDKLTGGSGRGILIGGAGNDSLTGGTNDDILIGGTTSDHSNIAVLDLLLSEWARTDKSYSQRVADLSGPTGGLNGTNFLNSSTVFNDNTPDNLIGGGGTDWFFSSAGDTLSKVQSGATVTTITSGAADLALTNTVSNATPNVGDAITYTITLTDKGPAAATNVTVQDVLPAGLTFVSATPSQGVYNSASGTWTVGSLTTTTPQTLLIRATVTSPNPATNTATISHSDQFDPNTANNSAGAGETPQQADLQVSKSVSNPTPNAGDTITYTITLGDNGPDAATNVTVQDTLPSGLSFVSATPSQGSYSNTTGVWTVGTVTTATSQTLTITARVGSPNPGTNTASVSHSDQFDPNTANNSDTTSTNPQAANLALAQRVSDPTPNVGATITFTVTLTDSGPSAATNVQVSDLLPGGLTFVSATPSQGTYNSTSGLWSVGTVTMTTPQTLTIQGKVVSSNAQTNTATISRSDQFDPNTANNTASATETP